MTQADNDAVPIRSAADGVTRLPTSLRLLVPVIARSLPPVDMAKVHMLQQAIAAGSYRIDCQRIAARLLSMSV